MYVPAVFLPADDPICDYFGQSAIPLLRRSAAPPSSCYPSLVQPEIHGARSPRSQAPRWLVPARCEAKWPHGARRHPFQSLFHRFLRSAIFGLSSLWVSPFEKEQFLRSGWRKRELHRAHARPFFANSLRNCSFPSRAFKFVIYRYHRGDENFLKKFAK